MTHRKRREKQRDAKQRARSKSAECWRVVFTDIIRFLGCMTREPTPEETARRSARWCMKHPYGCYERLMWKELALVAFVRGGEL